MYSIHKVSKNPKVAFAFALLLIDALLVALIIAYVPYTKIDWDAYMSQVSGFLEGERDYGNLKGDTGPLVYPAGFLYIYSAIQYLTGGEVFPAQGAVSVKMNVLLYAPSLLLLMLKAMDIAGVFSALAGAALVQILLGIPFLLAHPIAYISRAFNLGRVFIHFWSVNFKFVPEPVFVSKEFAVSLLITHLILLAMFAHYRWCKHEGGFLKFLHSRFVPMKLRGAISSFFTLKHFHNRHSNFKILNKEHIVTTMFVGNFIGILCARSLHYQFYSWYFYSLPYLLWKTSFPTLLRVMLFIVVEFCWNVFPSNTYSSSLLLCAHLAMLWGLWTAPPQYPYVDAKTLTKNKKK
ncbi:Dol-P-Man:Man(5)GlcNAc(2)-PP-Dol alpha-1,3-mannosyltransferase [Actinidia chinensis var. chinensis]|uniref:dolichyl-P-Man:Man5GlcNAc2-PP-dolichol alpha-1,3-mannosyltransferase n=1 Tax=Actinidia chinensis var. chinensis TaxID=1590841 RepID=A0A2R6P5W0_ACTCC|nr:Dol-P-Man:Man(5)GlcNAc(2)-PP-Dol alpha-1,3-mannosyltransferase [Actinidia chinensis var. chinensis]